MSNANSYELAMLDLINGEREAAGLEPLRLITTLNDAAETHSSWMLDTDMFSHSGADGSSPSDRMEAAGYPFEGSSLAAENIGWQSLRGEEGIEDDVAQVHAGLMDSPGHRANILNPDAEDIGIGIETGTFSVPGGSYEAVMVTQVFGATDADLSAWVDPGTGEEADDPVVVDEDQPVEDEDVVEEDTVEEDPEDDLVEDETEEDPVEEDLDDDTDAEDDDDIIDEDAEDDETDELEEDDTEDPDPEIVAEDDDTEEDPDTDGPEDDDDEQDEDVAMDDDMPDDMPVCEVPTDGPPALPFELSQFTVDLREAFEFTRDGDQLIWETTEEKLIDVFLTAFEDWAMIPPEDETIIGEADVADLMIEDGTETPIDMGNEDEQDDWMYDCGV